MTRLPLPEDLFHPCESHVVETIANLDAVAIVECGEPMVSLAAGAGLQLARPMRLREGVVARLNQAGRRAEAEGFALYVFDAYRHPGRQRFAHAMARGVVRGLHPLWPRSLVRELANKYVAAPDAVAPPPHTTGGAIDVRLVDAAGRALRMMPRRPTFAASLTDFPGLDDEARANRARLASFLTPEGFSNYEEEWWHWSHGDSGWALRTGAAYAIYGKV